MARGKVQTIEVLNWEKFNGRRDVKYCSWFRLSHSIASDPQFFDFDTDEKWVMICVFCLASAKNSALIQTTNESLAEYARVPVEKVASSLQRLAHLGTLRMRTVRGTSTLRTRTATDGRTDGGDGRTDGGDGRTRLPELAEIWNELSDSKLPKVNAVNPKSQRGKGCRERWEEHPDREFWVGVIQRINQSPFCLGVNDRGWVADFEFLIGPDSAAKVLEGKYDQRRPLTLASIPQGLKSKSQEDLDFEESIAKQKAMLAERRGYVD